MINYLKRFIPDFSTLTYPIRKLSHQDIKFEWSDDCEKSFQTLNNYLIERTVNTYFDEKKNTVIYCDTSPVGLSSILLQKDKNDNAHVIFYSPRSLTTTEQKYSQIEREYLSLIYACKRHHIFVFGRKFKTYCDNKTLVNLLKHPLPLRIERMLFQLQGYEFEIEYVKSESNIPDFIRRHPIQNKRQIDKNIYKKYVNFVTTTAIPKSLTIDDISTATEQNKFLQNLCQRIENNNWNLLKKLNFDNETFNLIKQYRQFKDTLTINLDNDIILKDNRIILPEISIKLW